jgi:hypothetical protein
MGYQRMTSLDTMLREVVVTLKEEQACLELWFKDKSVNEDVLQGIEISLTKISEALEKLAALEKGKLSSPSTKSGKSVRLSES